MGPFIKDILERPLGHRIGIWLGTIAVIGLLLWANTYSPSYTEYSEAVTKIESLRSEVSKEKRLALDLDRYKQEVRALDLRLEFALQELPDKSEIPELLSSVSSLAKEAGLEVNLFKVNAEKLDEFYARVPVEISVNGSYHQVVSFFDEVAHLPRIVNISQIEIVEPNLKNGTVAVRVGCVATTFRYLTAEEQGIGSKEGTEFRKRR